MNLSNTLKIIIFHAFLIAGCTSASSAVYLLPEAKSFGVASEDEKALMFFAMDRNVNLKGICFALARQSPSIITHANIIATTNNGNFRMHGISPDLQGETKEVTCAFGSEAGDFLTALSNSTFTNVTFDFSGVIRKYSFDTVAFAKILTTDSKQVTDKAADDYAKGIRAPIFYNQKTNDTFADNATKNYRISDQKLNKVWKDLDAATRKKLLFSQLEWIKQKAHCNDEATCLLEMTNKRIQVLEDASRNVK
ncbi:lysozyme inhibitor LprI family protein [Lelliottia sp. T2.26D-8]|uniref:lysozyme inhibitor LprI family protein n=1 Tax=Lelliottia sp. T2.26D-8 TaxID=3041165 RepID=UPI002477478E|nr:lysozyme inhibitor LprI family protein [Lelliottia sp. T2.26D-8]CAI9411079.1 hypothetical protein CCAJJPOJ_01692 [Lelliottia sp. T2.26D-8]